MARATRCAFWTSFVQIPAARPYIERLASWMPSASSANVSTESTGPKISSSTIFMPDFALSIEDPVLRAAHGRREVGVGEYHVRTLATQLQRDALHSRRRLAHDPLTDFGRAREGDFVHERMAHQRGAGGRAGPRHYVERARRQACRDRDVPEQQGGQRRLVRRLEHDRA